jgi:hypothetical protein
MVIGLAVSLGVFCGFFVRSCRKIGKIAREPDRAGRTYNGFVRLRDFRAAAHV